MPAQVRQEVHARAVDVVQIVEQEGNGPLDGDLAHEAGPGCGPCTAMLPEIGRWQQEYPDRLAIALISRGEVEENRTKASEHGLTNVLLQEDWEVSQAYRVAGTPSAVLLTPEGTIATPP
jgi:thiol-disulfide isomerase/thioredoxin